MEENRNEVVETNLVEQHAEKKQSKVAAFGAKVVTGVKKHWKGALMAVGGFALGVAVSAIKRGCDDEDVDYCDNSEPVETTCEETEETA